jgi:tetratricopeptide (TPR) repeat protein
LRAPVPGSIVNPAKLPLRARDSICEQCHLNGEERVPEPGKQLADFRPGDELESAFSVYVNPASKDPSQTNPFKVVSHVQQLALSVCARQSHGKLWCGTCHDPHQQPAEAKAYYRSRCLSCHGSALVKKHSKPADDCIGCHMPQRPVTDGAHTAFTDHRIWRRPLPPVSSAALSPVPASLAAWHDPSGALAKRNLGIAEVNVGERLESFALVSQGFDLLMACWDSFPNDTAVLTGLGTALMESGHGPEAAAAFEQAIQIEPKVAVHYLHAGLAWKTAHNYTKAAEYFEKTIQLDPLIDQPYLELATVYNEAHDHDMWRQTLERYVKAFPKSIRAQRAVRETGGSAGL